MTPERLVPIVLAALLAPALAGAHGVAVEIDRRDGAVAARARYEGGAPLAGARYEVVSPARPERAFDQGRTDRHGWVVFVPDAPGTWRVRIVDDSGHGHVAKVEVGPGAVATATSVPSAHPERSAAEGGAESKGTPTSTSTPTATSTPSTTATSTATRASSLPPAVRTLLGAGVVVLAFAILHAVHRRRRPDA